MVAAVSAAAAAMAAMRERLGSGGGLRPCGDAAPPSAGL